MKKHLWIAALLGMALTGNASDSVLTGNARIYKDNRPSIETGATLRFLTEGPFATDEELLRTGSRPGGTNRALLDGSIGPQAETLAFGSWTKGKTADFIIDLKAQYLVTAAELWAIEDPQRSVQSFEVLLSNDGTKFIPVGTWTNPGTLKSGNQGKQFYGIPLTLQLEKPALARFVEFRVTKNPNRYQMVLAEAVVLGRVSTSSDAALLPENQRPDVKLKVRGIQESAVTLDWSEFAGNNARAYHLYESDKPFRRIDEPGVTLKKSFSANIRSTILYPMVPGTVHYWGVAAEYEDGKSPTVQAVRYQVPKPFQCDRFGDMLAINHYWGGGGARRHPQRPHIEAWEQVALDLLKETPFKQIRWWLATPSVVEKLYENGIGITPNPNQFGYRDGFPMGAYGFTAGNEPDGSGKPMEVYNNFLKKAYEEGKKLSPEVLISAPTTGLERRSLEWLEKFYQAGMKEYFDVMDLHTYTKQSSDYPVPEGYPPAAPETLLTLVPQVREIMKKYGDEAKPMISTEFGYSDCLNSNPSGNITRRRQAEFLIRGLILHYVLGFKRVYVYSFWDEGDDRNYTEHSFGMVDFYMQKKPSYYASCVLGEMLGECTTFTPVDGMKSPDYGWNFHNPVTGQYIAVVWNGATSRLGTFATTPGKVDIVSMLGDRSAALTSDDGRFRVRFGSAPVYLVSTAPFRLLDIKNIEEKEIATAAPLTLHIPEVIADSGESAAIPVTISNASSEACTAKITLEDAAGKPLDSRMLSIPAQGEAKTDFTCRFGKNILEPVKISIGYEDSTGSRYQEKTTYLRQLATTPGVRKQQMAGVDTPIYSLASDALELTVDPARGGRILEMLDLKHGGNQLQLDYAQLPNLPSVPFAYCLWDRMTCTTTPELSVNRNAPYQAEIEGNSLTLIAGKELQLTKRYTVTGNTATLELSVRNNSGKEQIFKYYMHPEYTVGGTGDSTVDELIFPVDGKEQVIPFWSGLGERNTPPLDRGYWRVFDKAGKIELRQEFDPKTFAPPRLWFGIGAYNLEMETFPVTLSPGAVWSSKLTWTLR